MKAFDLSAPVGKNPECTHDPRNYAVAVNGRLPLPVDFLTGRVGDVNSGDGACDEVERTERAGIHIRGLLSYGHHACPPPYATSGSTFGREAVFENEGDLVRIFT